MKSAQPVPTESTRSISTGATIPRRKAVLCTLLALGLLLAFEGQSQVVPVGEETQVNTALGTRSRAPQVVLDDLGEFFVVWHALIPGESYNVLGRRFDRDGVAIGDPFEIHTITEAAQRQAAMAPRPGGGFVVVWQSDAPDLGGQPPWIQGQLLDEEGLPTLPQDFRVNTTNEGRQEAADLAIREDGSFVVVWQSDNSQGDDTSGRSIQGQHYDAAGAPVGGEFQVNTYTTLDQLFPKVSTLDEGFVVVWENEGGSSGNDSSQSSIQARLLDSSGPVGLDFQVNLYTTAVQSRPSVARAPGSQFLVFWSSLGSPGNDDISSSLQARRFAQDGTGLGDQFQVNTYTPAPQSYASAVFAPSGEFVVTWQSGNFALYGPDGYGASVALQSFAADGTPLGDELIVNTYTTSDQEAAQVVRNRNGEFVVVWDDDNGYEDSKVLFQRFVDPGVRIFEDGFESGDTQAWSTRVP